MQKWVGKWRDDVHGPHSVAMIDIGTMVSLVHRIFEMMSCGVHLGPFWGAMLNSGSQSGGGSTCL